MRKFISILLAALTIVFVASCTSCNSDAKFGIEYDLSTVGSTDAAVTVDFTNGHFNVNGAAKFDFEWSNVQNVKFEQLAVQDLRSALNSSDTQVLEAAQRVDEWLNTAVQVNSFEGHYDIYIHGYVRETLTGLKFEIDRRITNLPEEVSDTPLIQE